jgi:hypothetical protein
MSYTLNRFIANIIVDIVNQHNVQSYIDLYIKDKIGLYLSIFSFILLSTYTYSLLKQYKNDLTLDILYYTIRNIVIISLFGMLCSYHTYLDSLPLKIRERLGYFILVSIVVSFYNTKSIIWFWICFVIKNLWILFVLYINISLFGYIIS